MKAILLAGGTGSRLFPITQGVSKQLLPVYDKPMVYYPLSVLMLAGIREVLIITTPKDAPAFQQLLGTGEAFGLRLSYAAQAQPQGIAQAFLIAAEFIGNEPVCLILGDNIFYGSGLIQQLQAARQITRGALVFTYHVTNPQDYGVIEFDAQQRPARIVEKPRQPRSSQAVTGLYFYDSQVVDIARKLQPSARGELEITDINNHYLHQRQLQVQPLGRGHAWLDTGTPEKLLEASQFIQTIEHRQGLKIACLEEIAYHHGWISRAQLSAAAERLEHTQYGQYLARLLESSL